MSSFLEELQDHSSLVALMPGLEGEVMAAARIVAECIRNGGKLMLVGNGGSAADSQHLAAEFIGRFNHDRRSLPAIALTVDSSVLTCVGNDYGYEHVFARQIEGLARRGDALIAISTSGNSPNIINVLEAAKVRGVHTISFLGRDGGLARGLAECTIVIPSVSTARIQEMHIFIGHFICGEVERLLS